MLVVIRNQGVDTKMSFFKISFYHWDEYIFWARKIQTDTLKWRNQPDVFKVIFNKK